MEDFPVLSLQIRESLPETRSPSTLPTATEVARAEIARRGARLLSDNRVVSRGVGGQGLSIPNQRLPV